MAGLTQADTRTHVSCRNAVRFGKGSGNILECWRGVTLLVNWGGEGEGGICDYTTLAKRFKPLEGHAVSSCGQ